MSKRFELINFLNAHDNFKDNDNNKKLDSFDVVVLLNHYDNLQILLTEKDLRIAELQKQLEETKQTGSYQVMLMCQKENILLKQQLKNQPKEIIEKIKNICCIEDKCEDGSFVLGINEKDLDTILKEYDN